MWVPNEKKPSHRFFYRTHKGELCSVRVRAVFCLIGWLFMQFCFPQRVNFLPREKIYGFWKLAVIDYKWYFYYNASLAYSLPSRFVGCQAA